MDFTKYQRIPLWHFLRLFFQSALKSAYNASLAIRTCDNTGKQEKQIFGTPAAVPGLIHDKKGTVIPLLLLRCRPGRSIKKISRRKKVMIWSGYFKEYFKMVTAPAISKFEKPVVLPHVLRYAVKFYSCAVSVSQSHHSNVTFAFIQVAAIFPVTVCTADSSFPSMKLHYVRKG